MVLGFSGGVDGHAESLPGSQMSMQEFLLLLDAYNLGQARVVLSPVAEIACILLSDEDAKKCFHYALILQLVPRQFGCEKCCGNVRKHQQPRPPEQDVTSRGDAAGAASDAPWMSQWAAVEESPPHDADFRVLGVRSTSSCAPQPQRTRLVNVDGVGLVAAGETEDKEEREPRGHAHETEIETDAGSGTGHQRREQDESGVETLLRLGRLSRLRNSCSDVSAVAHCRADYTMECERFNYRMRNEFVLVGEYEKARGGCGFTSGHLKELKKKAAQRQHRCSCYFNIKFK
eukprot:g2149.t1